MATVWLTPFCRCYVWPVAVLAPVPLDPGRGGVQTAGLDIRNVRKIYSDYQEKYFKHSTVFQDVLQFGADHILLLLGEISSDLPSYLSVHHGGHGSHHQVRSRYIYNLHDAFVLDIGEIWRGFGNDHWMNSNYKLCIALGAERLILNLSILANNRANTTQSRRRVQPMLQV